MVWVIGNFTTASCCGGMHKFIICWSAVTVTLLLQFVLRLSYKMFLHCYAAVGKIFHRHNTLHGPSSVAELFVKY